MGVKEKDPNRFYVYLHRRKTDNEVFYVGKGSGDRARRKDSRSSWWNKIVNKHGYFIEYAEKNLSEQSAFDLEVELIKFYRETGHNLCNMTNGGEGTSGHIASEEWIARKKEYANSEEFKANMRKKIGKEVICSNGMTFETCKEAEKWIGYAPTGSKISTCCRRESSSAHGYVWRFLTDCDDLMECLNDGKDAFVEFKCQEKLGKFKAKRVYCSNGMVFDSGHKAMLWCHANGFVSVTSRCISQCCHNKKSSRAGLRWSFEDIFSQI